MLELGPLHGHVGQLHLRRVELRLGLGHVGFRGGPAFEARDGETQRLREGLHRLLEELFLPVGRSQLEIVDGHFGPETEARGLEVGRGGLASWPPCAGSRSWLRRTRTGRSSRCPRGARWSAHRGRSRHRRGRVPSTEAAPGPDRPSPGAACRHTDKEWKRRARSRAGCAGSSGRRR
jgi:hypothetical protein